MFRSGGMQMKNAPICRGHFCNVILNRLSAAVANEVVEFSFAGVEIEYVSYFEIIALVSGFGVSEFCEIEL